MLDGVNLPSEFPTDSGIWKEQIYEAGDEVEFVSVGFQEAIESIYRKVPSLA
jgi:hypothetical protein